MENSKLRRSDTKQTGKTTQIRSIAIQETGDSQHHGGPIEDPLKSFRPSQHYHIEGFKGCPNCPPSCRETPISQTAGMSFSSQACLVTNCIHEILCL